MQALLAALDGRKTYLLATILGVAGVLVGLGKVTPEQWNRLATILIPAAIAALRDALPK